jgi:hypothetical protein
VEISWADRERKEEVLHRIKEDGSILHPIKRMKAIWMGDIFIKNCLPKHVTEGMTEGQKWREDDEVKDVNSYWMILRKERIL